MSSRTSIADISNIPIGGMSFLTGTNIGSVTR
jgi:hypothetical protein